jgi:hypothetical protein
VNVQKCHSLLATSLFLCTTLLSAQEPPAPPEPAAANVGSDAASLAKAVQNPVASMISVPLQNNSNFAVGPYDRTQDVFNIQPVVPVGLGDNWMLITRVIQPIVWQPYPTQNQGGQVGIGDMNPTFFLSPARPGKLIWGVGPTVIIPTATSKFVGQGKLSFGPAVVTLIQHGRWTFGVLVNNIFSVVGSSHRPAVNQLALQYFITYNLTKGWNINTGPILAANWHNQASGNAADGDDTTGGGRWTVPFGGGVGRIMRLGYQPVNLSVNFYGNAVHPPGASPWGMRLQIALLYPRKPKG